jgi:hypothetical protein
VPRVWHFSDYRLLAVRALQPYLLEGLNNRSRRPSRYAKQLPYQLKRTILGIEKEQALWGAPKIRDTLIHDFLMVKPTAVSTLDVMLDRNASDLEYRLLGASRREPCPGRRGGQVRADRSQSKVTPAPQAPPRRPHVVSKGPRRGNQVSSSLLIPRKAGSYGKLALPDERRFARHALSHA